MEWIVIRWAPLFGLFRRPAPRPLTDAIRRAIEMDGLTQSGSTLTRLQMVESKGRYSNRKVTYFRVFDPTPAAQSSLELGRYQDFDVFSGRVLRSGHVERDGTVVLARSANPTDSITSMPGQSSC